MSTDSGILQQATVYSFIYSTSYQTENSTLAASSKGQHCVFLPSRSCVLPERAACSLTPALAFPSSRLLLYQQNEKKKKLGRISFCKGHRTERGGTGGQMPPNRSPSVPELAQDGVLWCRSWHCSRDIGPTHCRIGDREVRGCKVPDQREGIESQRCAWCELRVAPCGSGCWLGKGYYLIYGSGSILQKRRPGDGLGDASRALLDLRVPCLTDVLQLEEKHGAQCPQISPESWSLCLRAHRKRKAHIPPTWARKSLKEGLPQFLTPVWPDGPHHNLSTLEEESRGSGVQGYMRPSRRLKNTPNTHTHSGKLNSNVIKKYAF